MRVELSGTVLCENRKVEREEAATKLRRVPINVVGSISASAYHHRAEPAVDALQEISLRCAALLHSVAVQAGPKGFDRS